MWYVSGLDLGQAQDYTALVTARAEMVPDPLGTAAGAVLRFDVCHIHRWHLGTSYPAIITDLMAWFAVSPLRDSPLVVDATGVGRPVVDMLTAAQIPAGVRAYTITAGFLPGAGTVPKKDLVGAVSAAIQTRRIRFADELPHGATLEKELETFRVKVTPERNETFAAWREKDHDDLVLALALAVWYGERFGGCEPIGVPPPEPMLNPDTWGPDPWKSATGW